MKLRMKEYFEIAGTSFSEDFRLFIQQNIIVK